MMNITLDKAVAALFLALALYGVYAASQMPMTLGSQIGPGVFPLGVTIAFAVVAAVHLALALRQPEPMSAGSSDEPPQQDASLRRQVAVLVTLLIAVVAVTRVGYAVTMTTLVAVSLYLFEERRPLVVAAVAVSVTAVSYLLFVVTLGVRMPLGPTL